eukprot:scaffold99544_cov36-Prasinocladus_malaysianus.AAC.4
MALKAQDDLLWAGIQGRDVDVDAVHVRAAAFVGVQHLKADRLGRAWAVVKLRIDAWGGVAELCALAIGCSGGGGVHGRVVADVEGGACRARDHLDPQL